MLRRGTVSSRQTTVERIASCTSPLFRAGASGSSRKGRRSSSRWVRGKRVRRPKTWSRSMAARVVVPARAVVSVAVAVATVAVVVVAAATVAAVVVAADAADAADATAIAGAIVSPAGATSTELQRPN